MHDELDIRAAFDHVRAEDTLVRSTNAYISRQLRKRSRWSMPRWAKTMATAACMLVLFFSGYGTRAFFTPVSVVSIDINPSVELGVNTFDRVISVQGYNPEGEALAAELDLKYLPCAEAVERIVTSNTIVTLLGAEELSITVVGEDAAANEALCLTLEGYAGESNAQCYSASPKDVVHAHECGLSYGKYLAYQDVLKSGQELTVEEAQSMTMKEIRTLAGNCGQGHHGHDNTVPTETTVETTEQTQTEPLETAAQFHSHKKKHNGKHH